MPDGFIDSQGMGWAGCGGPHNALPTLSGEIAQPQKPVFITAFDPKEDMLLIVLEEGTQEARIETRPTRDRRGTDVLLDGLRMVTVADHPRLSASEIVQIAL